MAPNSSIELQLISTKDVGYDSEETDSLTFSLSLAEMYNLYSSYITHPHLYKSLPPLPQNAPKVVLAYIYPLRSSSLPSPSPESTPLNKKRRSSNLRLSISVPRRLSLSHTEKTSNEKEEDEKEGKVPRIVIVPPTPDFRMRALCNNFQDISLLSPPTAKNKKQRRARIVRGEIARGSGSVSSRTSPPSPPSPSSKPQPQRLPVSTATRQKRETATIARSASAPTPRATPSLPNFSRPFSRSKTLHPRILPDLPSEREGDAPPVPELPFTLQYLSLIKSRNEAHRLSELRKAAAPLKEEKKGKEGKEVVGRSKSNILRKRSPPSSRSSTNSAHNKQLRRASTLIIRTSVDASCSSIFGEGIGKLVKRLTRKRSTRGESSPRAREVDRKDGQEVMAERRKSTLKRRIGSPRDVAISLYSYAGLKPAPMPMRAGV